MKQPADPDWADLGSAWQEQEADLGLSVEDLQARLRRQRIWAAVLTVGEVLSLVVVLWMAAWMTRVWLTAPPVAPGLRPSPVLIILLLLPTLTVLWLRRRQRAGQEASALEGIDATMAREERLLQSMHLGSVMSQLALGGFIMTVLVHLYHHSLVVSMGTGSIVSVTVLFLYVYGLQIALIVWGRRVRRRRKRLEAVRRALQPRLPE
jgi:FtsH-binding integral membrane protein